MRWKPFLLRPNMPENGKAKDPVKDPAERVGAWTWESRGHRNDTNATGDCSLVWPLAGQTPRKSSGWTSAVHRGPSPSPPSPGPSPPAPFSCSDALTKDTTWHTNVKKKVKGVSLANCCGACDNETACEAWAYEPRGDESGECLLVWPLDGQTPRESRGSSTAIHRSP